jgi:ribosome-associated toxin RatA of RatAB toxin-antitoxin module
MPFNPRCSRYPRSTRRLAPSATALTPATTRSGRLRLPAAWAALIGAALALTVLVPEARATEARELSSQEEAELRAGKLVVRPELRGLRGAQLIGGMAWQLILASPADVYRALTDVSAYAKFLPAAQEVRLISAQSPETLFVQHQLGFIQASYYVRTLRDPARRTVRFRMDHEHPSAIRDAWGELHVSPYGKDRSIVSLVVMADLGEGLVVGMIREQVQTWMLRVPALLKRHVERH